MSGASVRVPVAELRLVVEVAAGRARGGLEAADLAPLVGLPISPPQTEPLAG